ncbi:MAG TPA: lytic transglycosylase domain-containing protein [Acetobacteraceae bacterium]
MIPAQSHASSLSRRAIRRSPVRILGCCALLALVAGCASQGPAINQSQEAAQYQAHARRNYMPPGPPDDPWGPYIEQASQRFDVPDTWIRAVMSQESGGREYLNSTLVTSPVGAMGLMQVMPETYDDLRARYNLGDDAYDPHDNILAGAAYMREMYDIYGSPGFLAAYNAGPHRLDDYLSNERPLPDETRHYVAMIAPNIEGAWPAHRSPAETYAMNQLPIIIPGGLRYGRVQLASNPEPSRPSRRRHETRVASLPQPPRLAEPPRVQLALATEPPAAPGRTQHGHRYGFHLIQTANAESAPVLHGGSLSGGWAVQVGAYGRENEAKEAVSVARTNAHAELGVAHPTVASVHQAHAVLWRARLTGLSREAAVKACATLSHGRKNCIVLSPESQS